jgi:hypothetical protein
MASLDVYSSGQTDGTIGLPQVNAGGYYEYRQRYLALEATLCRINTQSERVMLDFGAVTTTCEVRATGEPVDDIPAVLLKGTDGSNAFEVKAGTVGFGFHLGEAVTIPMLRIASEGEAIIGELATVTEIQSLGKFTLQTVATTVRCTDGEGQIIGTGAVTTLTVDGGELRYESSGTVGTATVGPGRIDCSGDISPRIFSVTNIEPGGEILDPRQTITHTAGIARSARVRTVTAA